MLELKSIYTKSEQFHIYYDQLKDFEFITVIKTLANNVLKHQITLSINKTILSITVLALYVFNLSTNLQYNDTEFKKLLIDSGIST